MKLIDIIREIRLITNKLPAFKSTSIDIYNVKTDGHSSGWMKGRKVNNTLLFSFWPTTGMTGFTSYLDSLNIPYENIMAGRIAINNIYFNFDDEENN